PLSRSNEAGKGWRKTETRRRRLPLHSSATPDGARSVEARQAAAGRADPGAMLAATASPLVLSLRLGATFHSEGREVTSHVIPRQARRPHGAGERAGAVPRPATRAVPAPVRLTPVRPAVRARARLRACARAAGGRQRS